MNKFIKVYIIDDASENDYEYLKEKFKEELNITIIKNEKNLGPGLSRQIGLDNSGSEFIMFIDSDDIFYDAYAVETLYNNIQDKEFVMGRIIEEKEQYEFKCRKTQKGCLHGKMYRRSIINKHNLKFCNVRNHEDNAFNYLYMNCCDKLKRIDEIIYIYQFNPKSITRLDTDIISDVSNFIKAYTWLAEECIKRNIDKFYISEFIYTCILYVWIYYIRYNKQINFEFALNELKTIKDLYEKYNYIDKKEKDRLFNAFTEEDNLITEIVKKSITIEEFITKIK